MLDNVSTKAAIVTDDSALKRRTGGGAIEASLFPDIPFAPGDPGVETQIAIRQGVQLLVSGTVPLVVVLRTLRSLGNTARIEAAHTPPSGASLGLLARDVSRLANDTSVLAERIANATADLQDLFTQGKALGSGKRHVQISSDKDRTDPGC